jgi:hypothetical protein
MSTANFVLLAATITAGVLAYIAAALVFDAIALGDCTEACIIALSGGWE